ncbi:MAG: WbqC family protein, partial [Magnetococcales bacterium]|nr:WbqC family protein [Magnetococcales bacterium]
MTTLAVLQPGYLPWLGFFDQMSRSDHFVYYDDVQYDKHGWRNRNRLRSADGPIWVTVPVRHKGLNKPLIREIEIDGSTTWA